MIKRVPRADGSERFEVYAKRNGKKVYIGSADSQRGARELEEDERVHQRRVAAGELPAEHDLKRLLGVSVEDWLTMLEKSGSRSHRAYSEFARYQIKPHLKDTPLARLTKSHVRKWLEALLVHYAPRTVNSALGCLGSACRYFVERGWMLVNPCYEVRPVEVPEQSYNWVRTRGELERLLGICPDELRDMVAFAVGTGLRLDEMLHLQWVDVDLELRLITVQRGRQGPPKNGQIRHVPVLDSVLPLLERRALRRAGNALVFPGRKGKVRTKTPVQCAFKYALKRAELDTSLSWHDLRHTCASWWVLGGGDIFRLSKLLGHQSVLVTQRTYAHLAPEAWQQDYARLPFHVPAEPAQVYEFVRGPNGKMIGKRAVRIAAEPVVSAG